MKKILLSIFTVVLALQLTACGTTEKETNTDATQPEATEPVLTVTEPVEIIISAAASLENAFNELKPLFEEENENIDLAFTFGGSGALQQQISQGAPVDVFFSAAEDKFNVIVDAGLMSDEYKTSLLKNTLVLIAPKDAASTVSKVTDLNTITSEKVAVGEAESVPAGKYAKQSLEKLNIWSIIEPNVVFGKDVSQVLSYVEQGNTDYGFVYRTDAISSDKISILEVVDSSLHDAIIYPVGILKDTKNMDAALAFFDFIQSEAALNIFDKYGFTEVK